MTHKEQIVELSVALEKALQERSIQHSPDKQSVSFAFMAGYYVSFTEGLLEDLDLTEQQMAVVTRRFKFCTLPPETVH